MVWKCLQGQARQVPDQEAGTKRRLVNTLAPSTVLLIVEQHRTLLLVRQHRKLKCANNLLPPLDGLTTNHLTNNQSGSIKQQPANRSTSPRDQYSGATHCGADRQANSTDSRISESSGRDSVSSGALAMEMTTSSEVGLRAVRRPDRANGGDSGALA